jgi:hypothetical protein
MKTLSGIRDAGTILLVLIGVALGQVKSDFPNSAVHVSGRMIDSSGAPLPNQTLNFSNFKITGREEVRTAQTDQDGRFAFSAVSGIPYEFYVTITGLQSASKGIGTIEAVGGQDVDLGNIVLKSSPGDERVIDLVGPIRLGRLSSVADSKASLTSTKTLFIAAIFIGDRGSHVILSDGNIVQPPKEKEQVGCSSPVISEDRRTVGWLVDSDFCCTSYPISLTLVVYKPGKPLRRFQGDGRAIFDWKFVAGGRQVALYQDFLHGTPAQHYELRDTETGRLIDKWDGDLTPKSPEWTRGLRS